MRTEAFQWPFVPQSQRPKTLFVAENLSDEDLALLGERGWLVQDVRLLPNTSTAERQAVVLAWLEGLRNGSILMANRLMDSLELEAKTCGLTANRKEIVEKPEGLEDKTLDEILDLKSRRAGLRIKA